MLGNNKLIVNQATMKQIVQEWLERKFVACDVEVSFVEDHSDGFKIQLTEKAKKSEELLVEGILSVSGPWSK